jgi:cytochrome c oxidase subunit III
MNNIIKIFINKFDQIIKDAYYFKVLNGFFYKPLYSLFALTILSYKLLLLKLKIISKNNFDLWLKTEGKVYNDCVQLINNNLNKVISFNLNKVEEKEILENKVNVTEKNLPPHEVLHVLNRRQKNKYYVPNSSYSPFFISLIVGYILYSFAMMLHQKNIIGLTTFNLVICFFSMFLGIYFWVRLFNQERGVGEHTAEVKKNITLGFYFFLLTEAMCFLGLFWTFFHSLLAASNHIGGYNPGAGIVNFYVNETKKLNYIFDHPVFSYLGEPHLAHLTTKTFLKFEPSSVYIHFNIFDKGRLINPYGVPLFNTFILLSSAASLNAAHKAIKKENFSRTFTYLFLTIFLGLFFVGVQFYEYKNCNFSFNDGIYACAFLSLTGLHGFHVILGVFALIICFFNFYKKNYSSKYHQSFEFAIWYWHFVDVIWIAVYLLIYLWPAAYFFKTGVFAEKSDANLYILNFSLDYLKYAFNNNYSTFFAAQEAFNSHYFENTYNFKKFFVFNSKNVTRISSADDQFCNFLEIERLINSYNKKDKVKHLHFLPTFKDLSIKPNYSTLFAPNPVIHLNQGELDHNLPIIEILTKSASSKKKPEIYTMFMFLFKKTYDTFESNYVFLLNSGSFNKFSVFMSKITNDDNHVDLIYFFKHFLFSKYDISIFSKIYHCPVLVDKKPIPIYFNPTLLNAYLESSYASYLLEQDEIEKKKQVQKFIAEFNSYNEECYRASTPAFYMILAYLSHELTVWVSFFNLLNSNNKYINIVLFFSNLPLIIFGLVGFIVHRSILPYLNFTPVLLYAYLKVIRIKNFRRKIAFYLFIYYKSKKIIKNAYNYFVKFANFEYYDESIKTFFFIIKNPIFKTHQIFSKIVQIYLKWIEYSKKKYKSFFSSGKKK